MKPSELVILKELEQQIIAAPRRTMLTSKQWKNDVPGLGGVYVIWKNSDENPIYVGETCQLNHRLGDLGRTSGHGFRRKIAKMHDLPIDDDEISGFIRAHFKLSFIVIGLGRKELEEHLLIVWRKFSLINKPPTRLILNDYYKEVSS